MNQENDIKILKSIISKSYLKTKVLKSNYFLSSGLFYLKTGERVTELKK